jgi:hypothetical protein
MLARNYYWLRSVRGRGSHVLTAKAGIFVEDGIFWRRETNDMYIGKHLEDEGCQWAT